MKEKIYGWQWFRDFFSITIFKYFVSWFALVPVFAKILEKLPKEIIISTAIEPYIITLQLPFKWEILWISSLFFIIAFILYKVFVPNFITKYFSLKYYKEFEHSPRWLVWEAQNLIISKTDLSKFVKRMSDKKYIKTSDNTINEKTFVEVKEKQTILYFSFDGKNYEFALPIINDDKKTENKEETDIAVREIFWEIFGRFSSSRVFIRGLIHSLLILSLVTFTIPFIQSICTGLQYFFK
ncbi:hypothetical protein [Myroides marinus]|uniref:hypothetical protein n=1 Tax=Myroides marinus TaxID=703342 RepID=UPI0025762943|nr:hypothetical protein [Myroides marinus]MDM1380883.1 hypothetical protein [Myroides marinus]MDM1388155.1 hypothetical protein [Myroides marinus]MDM1395378.1 hypothetical protein [Myroides marinus]